MFPTSWMCKHLSGPVGPNLTVLHIQLVGNIDTCANYQRCTVIQTPPLKGLQDMQCIAYEHMSHFHVILPSCSCDDRLQRVDKTIKC